MSYRQVKNKWNKRVYSIIEMNENSVKLLREDGSVFSISKTEFNFTYYELKDKNGTN